MPKAGSVRASKPIRTRLTPQAARRRRAVPAEPEAPPLAWERLRPRTLVERAVDAIIAGAARGLILPGDRIVEAEIARGLGVSRVPVREALRLLESQGLVVNEPYKGLRLVPLSESRLREVLEVRAALEITAARRLIEKPGAVAGWAGQLERRIELMIITTAQGDAYGSASADTEFHRELCRLAANEVLCTMWEQLARQLTIIVGLSTLGKSMRLLVAEHRALLAALTSRDMRRIEPALREHIFAQNEAIDFDRLIAERRRRRQSRPERVA